MNANTILANYFAENLPEIAAKLAAVSNCQQETIEDDFKQVLQINNNGPITDDVYGVMEGYLADAEGDVEEIAALWLLADLINHIR